MVFVERYVSSSGTYIGVWAEYIFTSMGTISGP